METLSITEREIGDPSLLVSSLHLLVPPLQLLSAAMWQVLQQQDELHCGKLEEFVSLVMETFPEMLSESQRTELTLGLQDMTPAEIGCKTDPALEVLLWEFLSRLDQLLPVPDLKQTVSWLSAAPSVLEVCLQTLSYPDQLKTLLRHHRSLGLWDMNAEECKESEQKDVLTNMKEEQADGERQSVKMEGENGVRDEEGLWKEEERERDEQREGRVTDQVVQTDKLVKNGLKSEQEGENLSTMVTSCLLKQPRVLIRRLEIANGSVPVSSPPRPVACQRDLGVRSPWRRHELSPLKGNGSLRQKGQVMTQKGKTVGQLDSPLELMTSSSENGICAEASLISPVISPRNQNTGQSVEVSSQVFACSQCPFVHTEEVNLHKHIEKVHPEELNTTDKLLRYHIRSLPAPIAHSFTQRK
ncbi:hypothetical protein SKAU_G00183530 [Synaphobranchus kaupii]|uniref:TERF1-interacting nuclear factor 2 N-terminal domain-containing protein n=1 Tax=Synaphobranchus kaupii TaxID=118154 RepID=A0A9Q1FC80_SYNKA|nr:hypothetical protein SKAU_G00183530 [Synaphobranchus kaupii]